MFFCTPADVEAATNGRVRQTDIRNWNRDGRFNTPIAEPRAGKPRQVPLNAVIEAALLREFGRFGVPLEKAKRWNAQLLDAIARNGLSTMDEKGQQVACFGSPLLVVFDPDADSLHIDYESGPGDTDPRNRGEHLFFKLRNANSAGTVPGTVAAIHLPALLSPIKRRLGIEE